MLTVSLVDDFLGPVTGQALREGRRYAHEARVVALERTRESACAVVEGPTGDWEAVAWSEAGALQHRCSCPSWRDPCKHVVALALRVRELLEAEAEAQAAATTSAETVSAVEPSPGAKASTTAAADPAGERPWAPVDSEEARRVAIEERVAASRRGGLKVCAAEAPQLLVASPSGFTYRVTLRGGVDGPHGCDCPDFEANRLHACKHVERVRRWLRDKRTRLPRGHGKAARRPRVYLHFGETVEPRLLGRPSGRGAPAVRAAFDEQGLPLEPRARTDEQLLERLREFGDHAEPEALAWVEERVRRRPRLRRAKDFRRLLPKLGGTPYDYQLAGAEFLARRGRGLLADEMGLGKTVQAILAAAALRRADDPVERVTIVCPASLRANWSQEIARWLGEETVELTGPVPRRKETIESRPRWLITHYEQVLRDHEQHAAHAPDLLILDEAQRAKGLSAKTARAIKAIPTRHLFALTGTPLENRLEEAYAIAQLVDQRLLPPLWQVDRDHFVREQERGRVVAYRELGELRRRLGPAFLRRRKEDVALELPERLRTVARLPLHPAVLETYEELIQKIARLCSKRILLPADLDRLQKWLVLARRCCNGPHLLKLEAGRRKIPKLAELEEQLRELCVGEGRKAVVFSEWTGMTESVEPVAERLGLPVFHLHGGVPVRKRQRLLEGFRETEGPAIFLSTDAGGLGLNLQVADVVINLDLPWNPARLEQRLARVHRIGSKGTVQVLLLVTRDTIEEGILGLHETKRNVFENLWSEDGEDLIAAPGGSGAFRDLVQHLIQESQAGASVEGGGAAAAAEVPAGREDDGLTGRRRTSRPAPGAREAEPRRRAARPTGPVPHEGERVDPAVLARAIAAVAPSLPPEHRGSLARVFRSLADALEEG